MKDDPFAIVPAAGFAPAVGRYVTMLEDVRRRTLKYIEGLSAGQLAWHPNERVESIGTQLLHIAAVETSYMQEDIARRPMGPEWKIAFPIRFEIAQISGQELAYFIDKLETVRMETRDLLGGLADTDLEMEIAPLDPGEGNEHVRYTIEWILYHLIEHEAHHKGQIALLKRLLPR
jgi:uncharacterized damage-inducible protein DinB